MAEIAIDQAKIGARYKGHGFTAAIQYEDVDNVGNIRVNGNQVGRVGKGKILYANLGYKFGNTLITGAMVQLIQKVTFRRTLITG